MPSIDVSQIENLLKAQLSNHFKKDFDFSRGTYGDQLLQAARIVLFRLSESYGENTTKIFNTPATNELFFRLLKSETHVLEGSQSFHVTFDPKLDQGMLDLSLDTESNAHIEQSERAVIKPHEVVREIKLNGAEKDKHQRQMYVMWLRNFVAELLDRRGDPKITEGPMRVPGGYNGPFFDNPLHRKVTVREFTKRYVLPTFNCSMQDLPIQPGLRRFMASFGMVAVQRWLEGFSKRGFFLEGYPRMAASPHWHRSRWFHPKSLSVPTMEERHEDRMFRLDYLFRFRGRCKTKDDVVALLNASKALTFLIKAEHLPLREKYFAVPLSHPYLLVCDLPGQMYEIKPWELRRPPVGLWQKRDGSLNQHNLAQFLGWAGSKIDIENSTSREIVRSGIPNLWPVLNKVFRGKFQLLKAFYRETKSLEWKPASRDLIQVVDNLVALSLSRLDQLFSGESYSSKAYLVAGLQGISAILNKAVALGKDGQTGIIFGFDRVNGVTADIEQALYSIQLLIEEPETSRAGTSKHRERARNILVAARELLDPPSLIYEPGTRFKFSLSF